MRERERKWRGERKTRKMERGMKEEGKGRGKDKACSGLKPPEQ